MDIRTFLGNRRLLMDGAMGTHYNEKYARFGELSELANTRHRDRILKIHQEYIRAGARLLRTNTFASNSKILGAMLPGSSLVKEQRLMENLANGYNIAAKAAAMSEEMVYVAADIGPIPAGAADEEEALLWEYRQMADAFLQQGAKIFMFETFADFKYILPTAKYIKSQLNDAFIMTSFCLNKYGYTKSGLPAARLLAIAEADDTIDSVGFNCGIGAAHMLTVLQKLEFKNLIVSAVPNSGYPDLIRDRNAYQENVDYFADKMKQVEGLGVNILGGCCGTAPGYIKRLASQMAPMFNSGVRKAAIEAVDRQVRDHVVNPLMQKLSQGQQVIVAELDPPHNGQMDKLLEAANILKQYPVDMITLSDSPMGKMRADSMMIGARVSRELKMSVMPHVACRDKNSIALGGAFLGAHINGIRNLLIVTGDPVPAGDRSVSSPVYDFNSVTLMEYLKQMNEEYFSRDPLIYGGALNYGRKNPEKEIERMKKKIAAGASYFLTQPIYSSEDIDRIRYIKSQVDTKILCGIMPLVSYRNAMFIKNEIYGINVPEEVVLKYQPEMSRTEGEQAGIEISLKLIGQMRDVADGYYFMVPFNRAAMIGRIIERMNADA